jgi:hypothetical protein
MRTNEEGILTSLDSFKETIPLLHWAQPRVLDVVSIQTYDLFHSQKTICCAQSYVMPTLKGVVC